MGWLEWITGILSALIIFVFQDAYKSREALRKEKRHSLLQQQEHEKKIETRQSDEIQKLIDLQIANIKQDLYDVHELYLRQGYMPAFIKESISEKYKFYHEHGANGVGTKLFNELMELPEYRKNKK